MFQKPCLPVEQGPPRLGKQLPLPPVPTAATGSVPVSQIGMAQRSNDIARPQKPPAVRMSSTGSNSLSNPTVYPATTAANCQRKRLASPKPAAARKHLQVDDSFSTSVASTTAVSEEGIRSHSSSDVSLSGGPQNETRCEVCHAAIALYRCPRCASRTCSLQCCQKHKADTQCSGKRAPTTKVAVSQMNDSTIKKDFFFLEDVSRMVEGSARYRARICSSNDRPGRVNTRELQRHVEERGTQIRFAPLGMSLRESNTTTVVGKAGHKTILWRVQWVFEDVGLQRLDARVSEETTLADIVKRRHFTAKGIVAGQLQPYVEAGIEKCLILIKINDLPTNETKFISLLPSMRLVDALRNKLVLEFPILHVYLPGSALSAEKDVQPDRQLIKVLSSCPSVNAPSLDTNFMFVRSLVPCGVCDGETTQHGNDDRGDDPLCIDVDD